ncbi:aminoglycoside phosphotransferase family protein [Kribbella pittospori]|uniref:Aminoglycoside phosphotransferase family protein n=1 Tax=Kribbella pittospori TaxID=722689 RepID=A0A4R0JWD9_9ACTN|nr:phosphotransferase [Kribbella pittospori]TCC51823.1 aminoglycoside phosphotransferase family protein [Kribbella pittospori]
MDEVKLQGGFVNVVVRRGDVVLREGGERAAFVRDVLIDLDGWPGAPRFLGLEDDGRERLSFIDGYVAWERPWKPAVTSPETLRSVGRLVREFHDLTAGTALAGDQEVVCHNDLSPKNTVYTTDGTRAIAFIDWDLAAPGRRIHDIAFTCWQYADLGDLNRVIPQWQSLLAGYGPADTTALIPSILHWQARAANGIDRAATAGNPAMQHLQQLGIPEDIRRKHEWIRMNAAELQEAAVQGG